MLSSLARRVAAPVSRRGLLAPASSRILSSSSPSSSSSSSPSSSFSWQPEQCKHLLFKPEVGANSFVADSAKLIGHVTLGEDCSVFDCVVMRADINFIAAGANTNVQDGTVIHVNDDDGVTLGANVTVGHACILHGCTIEDNVLVGMGSTVMDGALVGRDSIIGANALVTRNKVFPPRSVIAGSPAKRVREATDAEVEFIQYSADKYAKVMRDHLYLQRNPNE